MSRSLFTLLFLVLTADGLMVFLTPVVVYMLTGSIEYAGLSYAIWWLPRLLLIPLIGRFIDSIGVRPLSIISDCIKTAGCLLLVFYQFADPLAISVAFGVVGSLVSIGNSQTMIAYEKLVAVLSEQKEHHVNLMARMDFFGMIVGPVIGMLLIDAAGYRFLLLLPCLFYLANALFFLLSDIKLTAATPQRGETATTFRDHISLLTSLRFIFTTPLILLIVTLAIGNNMFDGLVEATGTALIDRNMDLPVKYFALIDIAAGVCGVSGTYIYSALLTKVSRKRLLLTGLVFIILPSVLLIMHLDSLWIFVLCYALTIIGKVITGNINRIIRIEIIPTAMLASTSSIIVLLCQLILPVVGMALFYLGGNGEIIGYLLAAAVAITLLSGSLLMIRPLKATGTL